MLHDSVSLYTMPTNENADEIVRSLEDSLAKTPPPQPSSVGQAEPNTVSSCCRWMPPVSAVCGLHRRVEVGSELSGWETEAISPFGKYSWKIFYAEADSKIYPTAFLHDETLNPAARPAFLWDVCQRLARVQGPYRFCVGKLGRLYIGLGGPPCDATPLTLAWIGLQADGS